MQTNNIKLIENDLLLSVNLEKAKQLGFKE